MAKRSMRIPPVLLIADTRPMVAAGFKVLLADIPDTRPVSITTGFDDVAAFAKQHDVALIIVGEGRDGASPLSEFHRYRDADASWSLTLLADVEDRNTIRAGLSAGASGIVSTMIEEHELQSAIARILAGSIYIPAMAPAELAHPASADGLAAAPPHAPLTPRQFEVLGVLAQGYSNRQIGRILNITESTVSMHLNAAFQALGVRNRTSAALAYRNMRNHDLPIHAAQILPLHSAPAVETVRAGRRLRFSQEG